jgi:DNA polymerase III alpha subunit
MKPTTQILTNQPKIFHLHSPIERSIEKVGFDIYNYEMLFNDEPTKKLIREGRTIGCFYIESPGMRNLLQQLNVDDFEMLTAASSIIRPGVAESGMMQEFIARHKDPSRRKYLVPELNEVLGETYGIMIYQEDVIKVAHLVAGLSLEEADWLRRAMSGKMRSHKAMDKIKKKFFFSCINHKKFSEDVTKELWRQIESFAGYAFCKAHSASFALLSFQVAYLKVHHPAEFMAGVLSNQGGYYSPAVYVQECKRLELEVQLPSVNKSRYEYEGKNKTVCIGLMAIKNLSQNAIDKLINEREENGKYISLADFIVRTKIGFEDCEYLIKCGAMDCFGKPRQTLLRLLDVYFKHRKILDENYNDLFMRESFVLESKIESETDFSVEQKCLMELEAFDYMASHHPLEFFEPMLKSEKIIQARQMERYNGKNVKMLGWYMTSKRIKTKKGDIMKFLSLEDLTGTFEAVLFPKTYSVYAEKTMSMGPYLIEGKVDGKNIIVEKLRVLESSDAILKGWDDSVENKYFGDVEKVNEAEYLILTQEEKETMRKAYVG